MKRAQCVKRAPPRACLIISARHHDVCLEMPRCPHARDTHTHSLRRLRLPAAGAGVRARNATQHSVLFWNHAAKLNCGMATRRVPESHCVVGHANATAGDILGGPGPTRDKRHAACGAKVAVNYGVQRVWIAEEAAPRFSSSSTPPPGMPGRRRGRRSVRRRGSLRRRRATGQTDSRICQGRGGQRACKGYVLLFNSVPLC